MTLSDWRDISLILLALEGVVILLIYGVILYYAWKGLRIAYRWLQGMGLPQSRRYAALMKGYATRYSQKIVRPLIAAEAAYDQATGVIRAIFPPHKQPHQE
ncbi:MAG TPA: hypothetical protein EYP25_08680 [Anaerolineae bacterium]|nr:hypothetical protein [Caldilineae bacterium]HID34626.1 hypothetical protein [Anaerolineae bacterium]HIQ12034.1 hypothetical protein [Caldilineales bacterium]